MKLRNKKAIITGANRNIGAAIAKTFATEEAEVIISYRSQKTEAEQIIEVIRQKGGKAHALHADFQDEASILAFFDQALETLGDLDILVNNAGGYDTSSFLDLPFSTFKNVLNASVCAPMLLIQATAHHLISSKKGGAIVNISSVSGNRSYPNRTAHCTAKAGLNMLTEVTALELGKHSIRVNAVCPGSIPYELEGSQAPEIPLFRHGKPSEIARAALFLASEDASYVTGHTLTVDGGMSLSY